MSNARETTPIAIVGIGCLLPGATTPDEFWQGLCDGADSRTEGDREIFGTDEDTPGGWGDDAHAITARRGGFVTEPEIDLTGLRLPAEDLDELGRVVRWPLHVVRQALADAGIAEDDKILRRAGLVLGNYSFPTERSVDLCVPLVRRAVSEGLRAAGLPAPESATGWDAAAPAANLWPSGLPSNAVADAFGLGGPRLALDAACSSTLYSMSLARDYLATGAADVVLAGAVCAPDPLLIHLCFSDLQAFPDNGVSQPFHPDSRGIVTGQGAGVLVLKRLADAQRDGDRIHAVIEAIGLSNDGSGTHLLSPNVTGQLSAYEQAYGEGVDKSTVDYIECHATGTPVGDPVELRGLARFFGDEVPLLGSVKGNIGHLLTVAGFTSVLKVVMAMRHGTIPATAGLTEPVRPAGAEVTADKIVMSSRPWPEKADEPRRAGVSAFGFGGTNAHVVLTEPTEAHAVGRPGRASATRMAVAGLGARVGAVDGLAALRSTVRAGKPALGERPAQRWYGADGLGISELDGAGDAGYVDSVDVDVRTYRMPPKDLAQANPQHLLLFHAADEALADAGLIAPDAGDRRVAVVIAMEMEPRSHAHRARFDIGAHVRAECARAGVSLSTDELDRLEAAVRDGVHDPIGANEVLSYIGNIMASRIASAHNLTGPAFTISTDATAGARAIEVAGLLLRDQSIEAVLVGGVELAAGVENTLARTAGSDTAPVLGDGAAALVLTRPTGAEDQLTVDATVIKSIVDSDATGALAAAGAEGLAAAGVSASEVGHVEVASPAGAELLGGLARLYPDRGDGKPGCSVSSLVPLVGDTQHAGVLTGIVSAALCLRHAERPAAPEALREPAGAAAEFADSALRLLDAVQPWLRNSRDGRLVAAVHAAARSGVAHVVLSSPGSRQVATATDWLGGGGPLMLTLYGNDGHALAEQAGLLAAELEAGREPTALIAEQFARRGTGALTAVLVAADAAGLRRELDAAVRHLPGKVAEGSEWATPSGSYCTPNPIGEGRVAFVYPGAFTSYPGVGRDLFSLFPGLLADFERDAERPWDRFKHHAIYPDAPFGFDRGALMRHEAELIESIPTMLAIGTNAAVLSTRLLRDVLGVVPDGGFGYSLGESSMLFAMDVWHSSARDDAALVATPLFRDQLRGPKRQVRSTWGLADSVPDKEIWSTHVLLAPAADVRAAMAGMDRVYLTHVNTPGETVVAGAPEQCRELISRVGCQAAKAPANHVMHGSMVSPVRADLAALNDYPLGTPAANLELLSSYDYAEVDTSDRARIAERISHTLCDTVDFARLTTNAHERGFRYFVEVGPGATCTRWIGETLAGRDHVAVSVDRRGTSTGMALAQAMAKLVSHGYPVGLESLFAAKEAAGKRFHVPVTCGGESISERVARFAEPVLAQVVTEPAVTETVAAEQVPSEIVQNPIVQEQIIHPEIVMPVTMLAPPPVSHTTITVEGTPFVFLVQFPDPSGANHQTPQRVPASPAPAPAVVPIAAPAPVPAGGSSVAGNGNRHAAPNTPFGMVGHTIAQAHHSFLRAQHALLDDTLTNLEASLDTAPTAAPAPVAPEPVAAPPADPVPEQPNWELPRRELPAQVTGGGSPPRQEPPAAEPPQPPALRGKEIWNKDDLLEFATGSVAKVFGDEFAEIDTFKVRVRLPEEPYHFVTRVTDLKATPGRFEPSEITTEYDIPADAWYTVDGLAPCAVTIEAGQCDLLLVSYLGIDFRNKGERVYRLLDSELVFHGGLPREGQTLRYEIKIDRFVWNGDALLFFFNYKCFADGELILELLDACAGFFAAAELEDSLGVVFTAADRKRREQLKRSWFNPLARTEKTSLTGRDLQLLADGKPAEVFGKEWDQTEDGCNPSIRLPDSMLRMIDEVTSIDRLGGPCGLGELGAVKHLDPNGWYFKCHFTGDPVLAGSLVAEGGVQLLQTYAMYLGLHLVLPDAEFQSVPGLRTQVKVRGQITPGMPNIRYHVEITEITLLPRPTVIADILVYDGDKPIISMRNFGIQVKEKPGTAYRPEAGGIPPFLGRRNHDGEPSFINELHLHHAAKGDLATAMGPEFEIYANSRAPYIPNGDFRFVDRIQRFDGVRGVLKPGSEMVTEYDCPPEAWYFHENAYQGMPNCVYMESSLQAAILLGYYQGATLPFPDEQLSIRNLDGTAKLVKDVDLRGKTIRQLSKLTMHQAMPGTVLQRFKYDLFADGELFYSGESLFGYHSEAALSTQVGLDNGKYKAPWLDEQTGIDASAKRTLAVRSEDRWFTPPGGGLRLGDGHLRLIDEVTVVEDGGEFGSGYLRGTRTIDHDDWYFFCHFYRDPVMPGSLGVEALVQALQVYAIENELGKRFTNPVFAMPRGVAMTWKYRGQILRTDPEMIFDLHIKEIRDTGDSVQVIANANVWKTGLRIYELTDVAVEIREDANQEDPR